MEAVKNKMPTLRFPEFQEEQALIKFNQVVESNLYGPRFNANDYHPDGNVKTIRGTDVAANGELKYGQVPIARLEQNTINNHRLLDGDLVMITTAECGLTGVFRKQDIDYISSAYGVRIRLKPNGNPYYFKYFFQTRHAKKEVASFVRKATVANLPGSDILRIILNIPTLPEQQKIATFLTAIDSKIEQLTKKKQLLEQYKKGVMQQIFSQKLRFKPENGNDFPDWEEKKYNEIFSFFTTNSLSREQLNYESGNVFNIHYGDIHTKFSTLFDVNNELVPFINPDVNLSKIKEENYCSEGDLVIADASEDYDAIGKTIEIVNLNKQKVLAGLHTFLARPNKLCMALGFSGYMLQIWKVRKQIMQIAQGTKVLGLATSRLGKVELNIPCVGEQTQIANFLSAIDAKIELVNTELEKTQVFKKGLLQQMFV